MKFRKILFKDAKVLHRPFLKEKDLTDVGVNVSHDEISLNYVRDRLKWFIAMYKLKAPSYIIYAIINEKHEFLGTLGLNNINHKKHFAEIGYWIANEYNNKGYCTIAIKSFLEKIKKTLDMHKVIAKVSKKNIASYKVLGKNEFKLKRELKNDLIFEKELQSSYCN